ncbi:MAG: hypothetical protein ACSHWW_04990, partial [Nonlabens sp.]|uniref:hypothetical protein n=1 Tax=Nonlabens sp. TaxID=1888209 RepID=UPI003EF384E0
MSPPGLTATSAAQASRPCDKRYFNNKIKEIKKAPALTEAFVDPPGLTATSAAQASRPCDKRYFNNKI